MDEKPISYREVVAIILWWAEGTKSRRDKRWKNAVTYPIELTNTDPEIIKIFLQFLRNDLGVNQNKIRLQLQIHQGDDQNYLESYWAKLTKIPKRHFNKTIIRPVGNKIGKSQGTCKVRFADKALYQKLESILEKVLNEVKRNPSEIVKIISK